MKPTITAFACSPDEGHGHARDMRVRWALEEVGRARLPLLDERVRARLAALSDRLGEAEWLEGAFSAADLMMVMVLRRLRADNSPDGPKLLGEYPTLDAYVARGEARRAYQRAYAAQHAMFEAATQKDSLA